MRAVYWRRRAVAISVIVVPVVVLAVVLVTGSGGGPESAPVGTTATTVKPPELPLGGRTIFPHFRVVAYYGAPQAASLGELGIGAPSEMAKRLALQARPYRAAGRPVLLGMELLADIADAAPGDDGLYRTRQSDAIIERYLQAARRAHALLILDIQPGRADFLTEAQHLEKWLELPDVSLALDPEWHVTKKEVPGKVIGRVGSREVNAVSYWLSQLVARHNLPQKLLVVHRFTRGMIVHEELVQSRPGIALTFNIDGYGTQTAKIDKYDDLSQSPDSYVHNGFKLFYHEDTDTMTPAEAMALRPRPELVVYE